MRVETLIDGLKAPAAARLGPLAPPRSVGSSMYFPSPDSGRLLRRLTLPDAVLNDPASADLVQTLVADFVSLGDRLIASRPVGLATVRAAFVDDGAGYWVMDDPGETLDVVLARGEGVPAEVADAFTARLAEAVGSLHEKGFVHAALSPQTVGVAGGRVQLLGPTPDMRALIAQFRDHLDLTAAGYAAPELYDGARRRAIDVEADVYAAGALAHRLYTGRAPVAAQSTERLLGEGLALDETPELTPSVRQSIEQALAPQATSRPSDIRAWAQALGAAPTAEPGFVWFGGSLAPTLPLPLPPPPPTTTPGVVADPGDPVGADVVAPDVPRSPWRRDIWRLAAVLAVLVIMVGAGWLGVSLWRANSDADPAAATDLSPPKAPEDCEWRADPADQDQSNWRLYCDEAAEPEPALERFDTETVRLADLGYGAARERLGAFYRRRLHEFEPDEKGWTRNADRARKAFVSATRARGRRASEAAAQAAQLALGQMALTGEGQEVDLRAAERRFRAAGDGPEALTGLAQTLEADPDASPARLQEALQLYQRAAEGGETALVRTARAGAERLQARLQPEAVPDEEVPAPPLTAPLTQRVTPPSPAATEPGGTSAPRSSAVAPPASSPRPPASQRPASPPVRRQPATRGSGAPALYQTDHLNQSPTPTRPREPTPAPAVAPTPARPTRVSLRLNLHLRRDQGVYNVARDAGVQACNRQSMTFSEARNYAPLTCNDSGWCSASAEIICTPR